MIETTFSKNTPVNSYVRIRNEFTNRILASNIKKLEAGNYEPLSYYDNFVGKSLETDYTIYSNEFAEYARKSNLLASGESDLIIEFIDKETKKITHEIELKHVHLVQVECRIAEYIGINEEEDKTIISADYSHLTVKKDYDGKQT